MEKHGDEVGQPVMGTHKSQLAARLAGVPQAVLAEAAAPPVLADGCSTPAAIKGARSLICRTQYLQPASQSAPADAACRNPN
ncbi:hypothetical protein G5714_004726 [Onychostoma macrolepis]|uniref:Uncharacterized protein n=1 Tax=Onychostoma macrolepis TaxID=369639 RepID=A0A7J6D5F9_9TELE|nr:hypothetical protein G5714_004726 [Onychostoma macrolepis]